MKFSTVINVFILIYSCTISMLFYFIGIFDDVIELILAVF